MAHFQRERPRIPGTWTTRIYTVRDREHSERANSYGRDQERGRRRRVPGKRIREPTDGGLRGRLSADTGGSNVWDGDWNVRHEPQRGPECLLVGPHPSGQSQHTRLLEPLSPRRAAAQTSWSCSCKTTSRSKMVSTPRCGGPSSAAWRVKANMTTRFPWSATARPCRARTATPLFHSWALRASTLTCRPTSTRLGPGAGRSIARTSRRGGVRRPSPTRPTWGSQPRRPLRVTSPESPVRRDA